MNSVRNSVTEQSGFRYEEERMTITGKAHRNSENRDSIPADSYFIRKRLGIKAAVDFDSRDGQNRSLIGITDNYTAMSNLPLKLTDLRSTIIEEVVAMQLPKEGHQLAINDLSFLESTMEKNSEVDMRRPDFFDNLISKQSEGDIGDITCMDVSGRNKFICFGTQKMYLVGYYVKEDVFRLVKLKGKTSITCLNIDKSTEYIVAGTVKGDVFIVKIKPNMLEILKRYDSITNKTIIRVQFTNLYLGFVVLDIAQSTFFMKQKSNVISTKFVLKEVSVGSPTNRYTSMGIMELCNIEGEKTDIRVVCLCGYGKLTLMQINPDIKLIKAIGNEDKNLTFPAIVIYESGKIRWLGSTPQTVVYMIWGRTFYVKGLFVGGADEIILTDIGECSLSENILAAKLINSGELLVVDEVHQIKFISVREIFKKFSILQSNKIESSAGKIVELKSSLLTNSKLDCNLDPYADDYPLWDQFICSSNYGKIVYMLSRGVLYKFELLSWKEYIEKLVADANFFLAIYIILEIAEGRYGRLWGVSSNHDDQMKKMKDTVNRFSKLLCNYMKEKEKVDNFMNLSILLLLKTENVDFLLNEFYLHCLKEGLDSQLINGFHDFIYANEVEIRRLSDISNSEMFNKLEVECQKRLIMNLFDNDYSNAEKIADLTYKKGFDSLFFYTYPSIRGDLILKPLDHKVGLIRQLIILSGEETEKAETRSVDTIDRIQGEITIDENLHEMENQMLKLILYIESVLRKDYLFKTRLQDEEQNQAQTHIMKWLMNWGNTGILWQINPYYFYDIFLIGFNKESILNFYVDYYGSDEESKKKKLAAGGPMQENLVLQKDSLSIFDGVLVKIKENCHDDQFRAYYLFLAFLYFSGLPMVKMQQSIVEQFMIGLIKEFRSVVEDKSIVMQEEDLQALVFDIFSMNADSLKLNPKFVEATENGEKFFQVMLLETNERYEETFTVYIKLIKDKKSHSTLFFQWIGRIFKEKNKQGIQKLRSLIPQEFNFLVSVDLRSCEKIWALFEDDLQLETTMSLDKSPEFQLVFLRKMMALTKSGGKRRITVSDDLKVLFFRRLSKYSPDEVLQELKSYSWPPMRVLEICNEFNVELAVAYINERLGKSMDALEVFKNRFQRHINEFEPKIFKKDLRFYDDFYGSEELLYKKHDRIEPFVKDYLDKMETENLMVKDLGKNSDNSLEVIYRWFEFLIEMKSTRDLPSNVFDRFLTDTFDEITNKTQLPNLINDIISKKPRLNIFSSGTLTNRLVTHCKRLVKNWNSTEECLLKDSSLINAELVHDIAQGSTSKLMSCDHCQLNLEIAESGQVFQCGHAFHTDCLKPTTKGVLLCETCLSEKSTAVLYNNFSGDKWLGKKFEKIGEYRRMYQTKPDDNNRIDKNIYRKMNTEKLTRLSRFEDVYNNTDERNEVLWERVSYKELTQSALYLPSLNFNHFDEV